MNMHIPFPLIIALALSFFISIIILAFSRLINAQDHHMGKNVRRIKPQPAARWYSYYSCYLCGSVHA